MTQETLREAVARAISNALGDAWEREGPDGLTAYYEPTDAAIATMLERLRTPSEGMIEAGDTSPKPSEFVWQAMLTAFQQENNDG